MCFRAAATLARIRSINGDSVVENLPELLQQINNKDDVEKKTLGRNGDFKNNISLALSLECVNFLRSRIHKNCKKLCEFEEIEISSKAVEVTVNNKEENSYDFCLDFVQESFLRLRSEPD
jgi:hypothetical protein